MKKRWIYTIISVTMILAVVLIIVLLPKLNKNSQANPPEPVEQSSTPTNPDTQPVNPPADDPTDPPTDPPQTPPQEVLDDHIFIENCSKNSQGDYVLNLANDKLGQYVTIQYYVRDKNNVEYDSQVVDLAITQGDTIISNLKSTAPDIRFFVNATGVAKFTIKFRYDQTIAANVIVNIAQ